MKQCRLRGEYGVREVDSATEHGCVLEISTVPTEPRAPKKNPSGKRRAIEACASDELRFMKSRRDNWMFKMSRSEVCLAMKTYIFEFGSRLEHRMRKIGLTIKYGAAKIRI